MQHLDSKLKALRLSGVAQSLPVRNQEAIHLKLSYMEFFELLIEDELARRQTRLFERRTQRAGFPALKTLDAFDFDFNPQINRRQIADLAAGRFIAGAENILFLGPPGIGKSHLAIAIGIKAIRGGYNVRYFAADDLAQLFADAHAEDRADELLTELHRAELVIIDDFGLKKLPPAAGDDFLDLVRDRYERAAIILTSNRPFEDWGKILGDNATATAILDRLLHHAHLLVYKPPIKSYRAAKRTTPSIDSDAPPSNQPAVRKRPR